MLPNLDFLLLPPLESGLWWLLICMFRARKWINYRTRERRIQWDRWSQDSEKIYLIFDNVMTGRRGHIASGIYDLNLRFLQHSRAAETLNLLTWIALINLWANYLKQSFFCLFRYCSMIAQLFFLLHSSPFFPRASKQIEEQERKNLQVRWLIGDLSIANGFLT